MAPRLKADSSIAYADGAILKQGSTPKELLAALVSGAPEALTEQKAVAVLIPGEANQTYTAAPLAP